MVPVDVWDQVATPGNVCRRSPPSQFPATLYNTPSAMLGETISSELPREEVELVDGRTSCANFIVSYRLRFVNGTGRVENKSVQPPLCSPLILWLARRRH